MINFKILTGKDIMECAVRSLVMSVLSGAVVGVIATVVITLLEG